MNEPYEITRTKTTNSNRVVFFIEIRGKEYGDSFYNGESTWASELQAFANKIGNELDIQDGLNLLIDNIGNVNTPTEEVIQEHITEAKTSGGFFSWVKGLFS